MALLQFIILKSFFNINVYTYGYIVRLVFLVHQNEDRGIPGFVELELAQPMRLAFVAKHSAALDLQSLGCAGASRRSPRHHAELVPIRVERWRH